MAMRRIVALLLALCLSTALIIPVNAYGAKEHNKLIESILFGNSNYSKSIPEEIGNQLLALEYATTICLDQFQGNYSNELKFLNDRKIHGIIESINKIDFGGDSHHRQYTHKGWSWDYSSDDKAHWELRKTLLLQTTNDVFDFSKRAGEWKILWFTKDYGYTDQCESFSAFLYYLHILGEYEKMSKDLSDPANTRKDFTQITEDIIPLAKMFPTDLSPDVFWELERHLPIIFATQKESGSRVYGDMMQDIQILAAEARAFALDNNDFYEPRADAVAAYCQYADELIEILKTSVPGLLEKGEYFAKVFYPESTKKKPWYQFW